ncbi:MAG: type II toxin-antitoxin system RelE/ParE family toxin [Xanthobacteraceae bacterium]|nr:type II toxin-antitoxin system RelE/ParE family toxin [Xanthobacteraceae bacterium]
MAGPKWGVRLSPGAELDFANILVWTTAHFGARQSRVYRDTLLRAIRDLEAGPEIPGSKKRNEIRRGLYTLHVARGARRGRHFLLYRVTDDHIIEIVRILHDQMDFRRHTLFLPDDS